MAFLGFPSKTAARKDNLILYILKPPGNTIVQKNPEDGL